MYGDPDELERIARRMRTDAAQLRTTVGDHHRRVEATHWVSTAADRMRDQVRGHERALNEAADAMVDAAAALEAHAQTVRERLHAIAEFEERVKGWFSSAAATGKSIVEKVADEAGNLVERVIHQPPIWQHWSVTPSTLPPPGDMRWLEVGSYLSTKGVL